MKTLQKIGAEIAALREIQPRVPARSVLGLDNHAAIDAQIRVLKERMSEGLVYEAFDNEQGYDVRHAAADAFRWMNDGYEGDDPNVTAPSAAWLASIKAGAAHAVESMLGALKMARTYTQAARADMLCKAGAYSENTLRAAERSDHWRHLMATCDAVDTAIAVAPSRKGLAADLWIECAERLPTGDEPILFFTPDLRNPTDIWAGIYRDGMWLSCGVAVCNVTHWSELMKPQER